MRNVVCDVLRPWVVGDDISIRSMGCPWYHRHRVLAVRWPDDQDTEMKPTFVSVSKYATFEQEQDCCSSMTGNQELVVETQDGGGGPYLVLSTDRWAFDPNDKKEVDKFIKALKDVLKGTGDTSFVFGERRDKALAEQKPTEEF